MDLTYLTHFNANDPDELSGTPYWILKSLMNENIQLRYFPVSYNQQLLPPIEEFFFRCKQRWRRFLKTGYFHTYWNVRRCQHVAKVVNTALNNKKMDAILTSNTPLSGAFLEVNKPIIYWTDYVFASLANFYPINRNLHPDSNWEAHFITEACLHNAALLIFSSDWAARHAIEFYGITKEKIRVVPFGANLEISHNLFDIKELIQRRSQKCIKLLFVGKSWYRKGGDIVLKITEELHKTGHLVQLTIVGCKPDEILPAYISCEENIPKSTSEGIAKLKKLYEEAHFLFVPSRADCCPIVLAEANAFAVPCITTYVGGIPTAIKDNINGMTFSLEATVKQYCDYIINLMDNRSSYNELALSSFNEYEARLNWKNSAIQVKRYIQEII